MPSAIESDRQTKRGRNERNKVRVEQKTSNGYGSGKIRLNLYLQYGVQRLNLKQSPCKIYVFRSHKMLIFMGSSISAMSNVRCTFATISISISIDIYQSKTFIFPSKLCHCAAKHCSIIHNFNVIVNLLQIMANKLHALSCVGWVSLCQVSESTHAIRHE